MTKAERFILQWQYPQFFYRDRFECLIADAIAVADEEQLNALAKAFPEWVDGFRMYRSHEGWWDELRNRAIKTGKLPSSAC